MRYLYQSLDFADLRKAANNITSFFEKLSECFLRLGKYCPRYSEYQALFVDSTRLQKCLSEFYATIINFCAGAYRYIQNTGLSTCSDLMRTLLMAFILKERLLLGHCGDHMKKSSEILNLPYGNNTMRLKQRYILQVNRQQIWNEKLRRNTEGMK